MLQKVNSTCDGGYQLYCSNPRICDNDIHSITAKTHGLTKASKSCGTILVALLSTASNNVGDTTLVETHYLSVHLISEHLQVGNCVYAMSSVPLQTNAFSFITLVAMLNFLYAKRKDGHIMIGRYSLHCRNLLGSQSLYTE